MREWTPEVGEVPLVSRCSALPRPMTQRRRVAQYPPRPRLGLVAQAVPCSARAGAAQVM